MAAAYAALVSLSHTLHQILHPPPLNSIIIPRKQIESLRGKVDFLIHFLETYPSRRIDEIEDLQMRIADTAYAAEDIIESEVLSHIRDQKYSTHRVESSALRRQRIIAKGLKELLSKVIRKFGQIKYKSEIRGMIKEFHSIKKELMKIRDKKGMEDLQPKNSTTANSSRALPVGEITMVGFDKHMNELMGALATDESNHQIIPIVGMGGIGKTTLATAIYNNPFITEHFHVRAWVTVTQEYTVRELLLRLLSEINISDLDKQEIADDEIGELLYKELFGRKYLIVMDDMWNIEAWEKLKMFLPHNENGSRVLVTTRLSNLTVEFGSCAPYKMDFLDEVQSWDLLRKKTFAEEDCPVELEEIGKDIAKRCSGLPLALVVIGGLLAKSERTRKHWEFVAGDITSALNFENDEHLMKILTLSYIHLPIYLKPCFLYLAVFPEDFEIRVSTLVRLWVAEALIRVTQAKYLEEVAEEYLEDLISRNVILVHKRGSSGKVRYCKIHDLLRDLCISEAKKENFVYITKLDNPNISPNIETKRRLSISSPRERLKGTVNAALRSSRFTSSWLSPRERLEGRVNAALQSARFTRSWLSLSEWSNYHGRGLLKQIIHGFRLLKVVHMYYPHIQVDILKLHNLRFVVAPSVTNIAWMSLSWNLQTLVVDEEITNLPAEIWQMPQLRHLMMDGIALPDPPSDDQNVIVLENLQTVTRIRNFRCTEEFLKRIPNLKKLQILYDFRSLPASEQVGCYCLKNLVRFKKLESLGIDGAEKLRTAMAFPISLKKLSLERCSIPWEDLSIVGSLPNLEVLKLYEDATEGKEWNPIEGEFCQLKFLKIWGCDLELWGAENYHFPCLERLVLGCMTNLKEIPISFAEILTLQVVELGLRDNFLRTSAREISEQRELLGYDPLQIRTCPTSRMIFDQFNLSD